MEDEVRWVNLIKRNENILLNISYRDFATIKVEKRVNKLDVTSYDLTIDIFEVVQQEITIYKLNDIERILKEVKEKIEDLYESISEFDEEDLDKWIEDFTEEINNY